MLKKITKKDLARAFLPAIACAVSPILLTMFAVEKEYGVFPTFGATMFIIGLCLGFTLLYFLPTSIAAIKNHPRYWMIFTINTAGGWTIIGWVLCLLWALVPNTPKIQKNHQKNQTK